MLFPRTIRLIPKAAVFVSLFTVWVLAFSGGAPIARTGGFGEGTCRDCHSDYKLDSGRNLDGYFMISGVPDSYMPGETYPITVTIDQPGLIRWGFQLAARFRGSAAQAGTFEITDPKHTQAYDFGWPILYMNQTRPGSYAGTSGPISWTFNWIAPNANLDAVVFNAAGVAANNNGFPTGDYVYLAEEVAEVYDGS